MKKQFDSFFSNEMMGTSEVYPIISLDENPTDINLNAGDELPILPLRNMVIYPGVLVPVSVARPKSLRLIRQAQANDGLIGACTQIDKKVEDPTIDQLYRTGVAAHIVRVLEMPDSTTTVILEGKKRFQLGELVTSKPYLKAKVFPMAETLPDSTDKSFVALTSTIRDLAVKIIEGSGIVPPEMAFAIKNIENPVFLINYICTNFGINVEEKQRLLEIDEVMERGYELLNLLNKESQMIEIKASIHNKVKEGIDQQQREYFLQQQMKTIQSELGENSPEYDAQEFRDRAKKKKWTEQVAKTFDKELKKLERMRQHSPEYTVQLNYVETMLDIPWGEYTKDNFNQKNAKKVLD